MSLSEDLDLGGVCRRLHRELEHDPPVGYLRGRTLMRDVLASRMGFSALEAEELVDTLEARGYVRFEGDPTRRSEVDIPWIVGPAR